MHIVASSGLLLKGKTSLQSANINYGRRTNRNVLSLWQTRRRDFSRLSRDVGNRARDFGAFAPSERVYPSALHKFHTTSARLLIDTRARTAGGKDTEKRERERKMRMDVASRFDRSISLEIAARRLLVAPRRLIKLIDQNLAVYISAVSNAAIVIRDFIRRSCLSLRRVHYLRATGRSVGRSVCWSLGEFEFNRLVSDMSMIVALSNTVA